MTISGMHSLPGAVEVEGAGTADGDEAQDVLVEIEGGLDGPANDGDVVQ